MADENEKEAVDRLRLARERREAEQRQRLDELRAHAAAAQAQRERRDEERRQRIAEQRQKDDEKRQQVENRKQAIWLASESRREALLQRERERTERLERARAARNVPRPGFAFGSSTPRILEPVDSPGLIWEARSCEPLDRMNFYDAMTVASTSNVMFASAPLTRSTSSIQLESYDQKDESDNRRQTSPAVRSTVARRRTDLVPTIPLPRAPEPTSRPGSSISLNSVRRPNTNPSRPRPASIACTGSNTPKDGPSEATTPSVSRDGTMAASADVPLRLHTPRRPRPVSAHVITSHPSNGKPPVYRKTPPSKSHGQSSSSKAASVSPEPSWTPKTSKESSFTQKSSGSGKAASSVIPVVNVSSCQEASKDSSLNNQVAQAQPIASSKNQVSAIEVSQKLVALQIQNEVNNTDKTSAVASEVQAETSKADQEKPPPADEDEMTASMTARRITTEEEAKAALAERRRLARKNLERHEELERQRLQREAEAELERQRLEEERQRLDEEETRKLAQLQREMVEEKLRKAIEKREREEKEEAERKAREETEKLARLREEEEKKRAAEEAERLRKEEAEREEKERLARKKRVEAIMMRTRLKKADEQEENKYFESQAANVSTTAQQMPAPAQVDNGNAQAAENGFNATQINNNNGNLQCDIGQVSANFIQSERIAIFSQVPSTSSHVPPTAMITEVLPPMQDTLNKVADVQDDCASHNGHGASNTFRVTVTPR